MFQIFFPSALEEELLLQITVSSLLLLNNCPLMLQDVIKTVNKQKKYFDFIKYLSKSFLI